MLDLGSGRQIKKLTHYALRHDVAAGIQNGQLRNWELQAGFKKDGPWTTLRYAECALTDRVTRRHLTALTMKCTGCMRWCMRGCVGST
eukprot:COSAG01_NODE_26090_length_723_cov_9.018248_2_plen_88_part_00